MKVIFFGTPQFAANVLEYLLQNKVDVVAVVSKPDKAKGRSSKLVPTPVKVIAEKNSLPVYQPEKVSAQDFADVLPKYEADLFVVVAYGEIIKQHILDMPRLGCINLHASVLPKYRGAAPIQHAIIDGEKEAGVTIIHLVKKMDAGDMLGIAKVTIEQNDTYGELTEKLCDIGSPLLLKVINELKEGTAIAEPQDDQLVTFASKIELEDCEIDWGLPVQRVHDLIRGVNPAPGAWCWVEVRGERKRLKVYQTELSEENELKPFHLELDKKRGLIVGCGEGALLVKEVQLEGKRRMSSSDLLRGVPLEAFNFKP